MTTPTTNDYLKYANLQMAAEAFLVDAGGAPKTGKNYKDALMAGNLHASLFTETQATDFTDPVNGWKVLDQRVNSQTGFSGTLFQNNKTGELVISFRSTEFIDDAVRDNLATNTMEIKDTGWAWGQMADMEQWYGDLSTRGLVAPGNFSVTGYSLGGHLATAFNLLHPGAAQQVVTFNGAGVGLVESGHSLGELLQDFKTLSESTDALAATLADEPAVAVLYRKLAAESLTSIDAVRAAKLEVLDLYPPGTMPAASSLTAANNPCYLASTRGARA